MSTTEAKNVLKAAGYYVENLWHVSDVNERYKADNDQAQAVLDWALTNESVMEHIWEAIHLAAEEEGLSYVGDDE
jgi:hypothetical protein